MCISVSSRPSWSARASSKTARSTQREPVLKKNYHVHSILSHLTACLLIPLSLHLSSLNCFLLQCIEYPNAMECLQKADKRSMLPLNTHNNGREEIGTGDKEMKTSRQSVCLPPGGYLQAAISIQFGAPEKCFIQ